MKNRFGNQVIIAKESNKEGNLIYPADMTHDEAKSCLDDAGDELVRSAAMILRSDILNMPKTKMPIPTSVHTLKANSPVIPLKTKPFYQTLFSGLTNQKETS